MPKMDDHKGIKVPSETNEPGKRVEQELTDKRTKKENAKKEKEDSIIRGSYYILLVLTEIFVI